MKKELIICIVIIILVILGDIITYNYTKNSVNEAANELNQLREYMLAQEQDTEKIKQSIEDISNKWNERHQKLAYYIEHDELEKVETDLSALKGYIEVEEYKEAVAELDRTNYVLQHIKNKTVFNLQNIF